MDGNGEARRSSTTGAVVGLSNRRCKTISVRNPAEGGHAELLTTVRLRERVNKRDREKNLISRSKRRRRGVSRVDLVEEDDEGEENDGETSGSEEDDDVADGSGVPRTLSLSTTQSTSNKNDRNSLPLRVSKRSCKVADEMTIGVPVPRKTRSASAMRSHENTVSGTCGGRRVFGEEKSNQNRSNLTKTPFLDLISASSSNIVITENINAIELKTRTPPSSVHQDDIEFEIAEVLSGLMKQSRTLEKHESPRNLPHKTEPEKINSTGDETRRSISFPFPIPSQTTTPTSVLHYGNNLASDPRHSDDVQKIKLDDDRSKTIASTENELFTAAVQIKSEQHVDVKTHQKKLEKSHVNPSEAFCDTLALKDKLLSPSSSTMKKDISFVDERREERLKFDLMTSSLKSSPPVCNGSSSSVSEDKPIGLNTEMTANVKCEKKVELSITKASELGETQVKSEEKKAENFDLYFEKKHIDDNSKLEQQDPKPHSKDIATKMEKTDSSCLSPLAIALDCSYNSLPPFKWIPPSQAGGSLLPNMAQTPKNCVTHYYVARNIYSHQQYGKMNYFFDASNASQASKLAAANLPGHSDDDKSIELVNFMDRSEEEHLKRQESQPTPSVDLVHGSVFTTTTSQHQIVQSAGVHQPEDLKSADSLKNAHLSGNYVAGALPLFAAQKETLSYSYPNSALNQAPYLAILPNKGTPLPISTPVESSTAYKASTPPQAVHFLNGLWYPPHIHHAQLQHQPPQTIQHPWSVQATGNNIYLLGSSDMQLHQSVRQHPPLSNQTFKVEETMRNNAPSASDSKPLNSQKSRGLFTLPVQMLNFSLGPSTMLGEEEDGHHGGNQPKQKFQTNGLKGKVKPPVAMQFSSFNGNGSPSNVSFRTVSQKPILFQNLPDDALAPAPQAMQQKIHQPAEKEISGFSSTRDEYTRGNSGNPLTTAGTLVFNHQGRTLNFMQPTTTENWSPRTITSAGILPKGSAADRSKGPQHQMLLPLQQQQILQQSQSARSKMITRNSIPFAPHALTSPNSAIAFQQPLITCNSSVQSSQAKKSERSMSLLVPSQQGKAPGGQTQISFGGTHKPSLLAAANSK